jgi:hypothetical protein
LLNFVGCALGGAQDEAMGIAVKVLTPFFGPPQGIVIGCGDRPDALNAAFLNAVSANVLEYDDTHLGTVMHPAAPVAPGLFALVGVRCPAANCCRRLFSARDFVPRRARRDADTLPARLPHHRELRDFRGGGRRARLLGLDRQRTAWALGHAATQSASFVESIGSMAKSLGVGNAAKNGLAAALFAEGGFSGPESPIEGRYGFAEVMSDSADLARIADGIGQCWEVLNNTYKPYPCGVVLFPVIDACLELRARLAPETEAIDRVVVRGHPLMRERTDKFKTRIRDPTRRTRGISLPQLIEDLKPYLIGWRGYFAFCQTPRVLTNSCVRQVSANWSWLGCGGSYRSLEQHPFVRSEMTIPSSRPAFRQSAARSGSQGCRRERGGTGGAGAKRPPLSRGQALDRASTVLG